MTACTQAPSGSDAGDAVGGPGLRSEPRYLRRQDPPRSIPASARCSGGQSSTRDRESTYALMLDNANPSDSIKSQDYFCMSRVYNASASCQRDRPDAAIDRSLLGHIIFESYLAGTFGLEGQAFHRTSAYLIRYLDRFMGTVVPEQFRD